ncbi:unnamed protein product [Protopolystoma xenopodis]|uniref:Uncharacterized protein n=1 Tax=Protopolystoma xenopodis TaxID=117903 RepID=A0A448WKV0_9PLAT|nr:unnamed protein product [Protopolystoma xenopodis]
MPPVAHFGPAPISVRLLSRHLRVGQTILINQQQSVASGPQLGTPIGLDALAELAGEEEQRKVATSGHGKKTTYETIISSNNNKSNMSQAGLSSFNQIPSEPDADVVEVISVRSGLDNQLCPLPGAAGNAAPGKFSKQSSTGASQNNFDLHSVFSDRETVPTSGHLSRRPSLPAWRLPSPQLQYDSPSGGEHQPLSDCLLLHIHGGGFIALNSEAHDVTLDRGIGIFSEVSLAALVSLAILLQLVEETNEINSFN